MSAMKTNGNAPLENAGDIIDAFGGIRPMSKKIDVAVTTIQGWKKRDVIPAARRAEILQAAEKYNVNLAGLVGESTGRSANENNNEAGAGLDARDESDESALTKSEAIKNTASGKQARAPDYDDDYEAEVSVSIMERIRSVENQTIKKSMWLSSALFLLLSIGIIVLLFPQNVKIRENESRISYIESQVRENGGGAGMFANMIPESLQNQIESLQNQAKTIQSRVSTISEQAENISRTMTEPNAGNLAERIERLEKQIGGVANNMSAMGIDTSKLDLSSWFGKIDTMKNSQTGQAVLNSSAADIRQIMQALGIKSLQAEQDNPALEEALVEAQQEDDELGEVLKGLNKEDMKAAVMLLSLNQFRSAVNREDSFADDLALMQSVLGTDDNEVLNEALTRLSPHAEDGVLSPQRLNQEFKGLAGDIVVSSLKGEDVSVQERAKARLNEVLEIKKDGELITGTDTQARVARAQAMLDEGNIQGAIKELESLEGNAADTAQPWVEEAKASLLAKDVEGMMTADVIGKLQNMGAQMSRQGAGTGMSYGGVINTLKSHVMGYKVYRDEESGYTIMAPERNIRNPVEKSSPLYQ